jgi:hypothetical protein
VEDATATPEGYASPWGRPLPRSRAPTPKWKPPSLRAPSSLGPAAMRGCRRRSGLALSQLQLASPMSSKRTLESSSSCGRITPPPAAPILLPNLTLTRKTTDFLSVRVHWWAWGRKHYFRSMSAGCGGTA